MFFVAKYNEAILLVFLVEKYTLSNYLDASKNTTVCSVFTCLCCVIFSLNVCSVSYLCFSCCCICVLFLSWSCLIFIQPAREARRLAQRAERPRLLKCHVRREKGPTRGPRGPSVAGRGAHVSPRSKRSGGQTKKIQVPGGPP